MADNRDFSVANGGQGCIVTIGQEQMLVRGAPVFLTEFPPRVAFEMANRNDGPRTGCNRTEGLTTERMEVR